MKQYYTVSPEKEPDLFHYLCNRMTGINRQKWSNTTIKCFNVEMVLTEDIIEAREVKDGNKSS